MLDGFAAQLENEVNCIPGMSCDDSPQFRGRRGETIDVALEPTRPARVTSLVLQNQLRISRKFGLERSLASALHDAVQEFARLVEDLPPACVRRRNYPRDCNLIAVFRPVCYRGYPAVVLLSFDAESGAHVLTLEALHTDDPADLDEGADETAPSALAEDLAGATPAAIANNLGSVGSVICGLIGTDRDHRDEWALAQGITSKVMIVMERRGCDRDAALAHLKQVAQDLDDLIMIGPRAADLARETTARSL